MERYKFGEETNQTQEQVTGGREGGVTERFVICSLYIK
jgi:hypothetical protein